MTSFQTTCHAIPLQSIHTFKSNKHPKFVVHAYWRKSSCQFGALNVAWRRQNNNKGVKNCKADESWTNITSSDVHFSGWFSPAMDQYNQFQNTRWILATGVFLLAGITFTSLSLSKQMSLNAEISDNWVSVDHDNPGFSFLSKSEGGICSRMNLTLESTNIPEHEASQPVDDDYMYKSLKSFSTDDVSMETGNQSQRSPSAAISKSKPSFKFLNGEDESSTIIEPYESYKRKMSLFSGSNHDQLVPFPTLSVLSGKVLVPPVVDEIQLKTLKALKVLKVIDTDALASDFCTRREYARWLVSASSVFSSNTASKVYPAMYIENISELAFDDVMPNDPDFASIQGLAEAGIISSRIWESKLHQTSMDKKFYFYPESPLCRQDLVSWKIALNTKLLPKADEKILYECSGFLDIDKISCDVWPAVIADLSSSDSGIITLAFGHTKLFQPGKPVTKGQAAIALSTSEASYLVSEEVALIETESNAKNVHMEREPLVRQAEECIHDRFEWELTMEREKIISMDQQVAELRQQFERLKEKEGEAIYSDKERNMLEVEMTALSQIRHEVKVEMQELEKNKVILSCRKERITMLQNELECEHKKISQLHCDLGIERKALYMARAWAEEEGRKAREEAKALEKARGRWEKHGIKVVVGRDLREVASPGVTWVDASSQTLMVRPSAEGVRTLAGVGVEKMREWSVAALVKMMESKKFVGLIMLKISMIFEQGKRNLVNLTQRFNSTRE